MTSQELLEACFDLGLHVEPCEQRLLIVDMVNDPPYVPAELFRLLVEYRDAIAAKLQAAHLVRQIALGEFDGCDDATRRELAALLRPVVHPLALRALERLGAKP